MRKGDKKRVIDLLTKARDILSGEGQCPDFCPSLINKPENDACGRDECCMAADKLLQTAIELLERE